MDDDIVRRLREHADPERWRDSPTDRACPQRAPSDRTSATAENDLQSWDGRPFDEGPKSTGRGCGPSESVPKPQGPKVGPPEDHTSWSSGTEEAEIAAADDVARLVTKEDV